MPEPVDRRLLAGDAPQVAPLLLGKLLRSGGATGRIAEVEAYTADDPASHSARGRTPRNASMFAAPGTLYVYLAYGLHHCANVVTGPPGDGQAVLVRALEPVEGLAVMRDRRPGQPDRRLAAGPGTLCVALAIDRGHDGVDLCDPRSPVVLLDDGTPPPDDPIVGPRVGITRATDRPWRWRAPSAPGRRTSASRRRAGGTTRGG